MAASTAASSNLPRWARLLTRTPIANRYQHVTTAGPLSAMLGAARRDSRAPLYGLFKVAAIMMCLNQKAGGQDIEFTVFACLCDA
jgi:hypothetical protein